MQKPLAGHGNVIFNGFRLPFSRNSTHSGFSKDQQNTKECKCHNGCQTAVSSGSHHPTWAGKPCGSGIYYAWVVVFVFPLRSGGTPNGLSSIVQRSMVRPNGHCAVVRSCALVSAPPLWSMRFSFSLSVCDQFAPPNCCHSWHSYGLDLVLDHLAQLTSLAAVCRATPVVESMGCALGRLYTSPRCSCLSTWLPVRSSPALDRLGRFHVPTLPSWVLLPLQSSNFSFVVAAAIRHHLRTSTPCSPAETPPFVLAISSPDPPTFFVCDLCKLPPTYQVPACLIARRAAGIWGQCCLS